MTDTTAPTGPPPDAPVVGATSSGWAGILVALTALVLVAIAAFSLIGTQPQRAPVIVKVQPGPGGGGARAMDHAIRAGALTLGR